jgi:hypothetical protein
MSFKHNTLREDYEELGSTSCEKVSVGGLDSMFSVIE